MSCSEDTVEFNNGDELSHEFCLREKNADGTPGAVIDLTGITNNVTAEIWWRRKKRLTLTVGNGITISNPNPPAAADPEDQAPQGVIDITELQGESFPFGRLAYLKLKVIDAQGLTSSSDPLFYDKRLP
jgi:hypothetical protein